MAGIEAISAVIGLGSDLDFDVLRNGD